MFRRIARLAGLVVLCAVGCGGGDDGRHLSGTVTFDGKPVAAGVIYFDPDGAKEHTGSQGYAVIKNGHFDTRDGDARSPRGRSSLGSVAGTEPSPPSWTWDGRYF